MSRIPAELTPDDLYKRCDPATLGFDEAADLADLEEVIGQARAVQAVEFGVGAIRYCAVRCII